MNEAKEDEKVDLATDALADVSVPVVKSGSSRWVAGLYICGVCDRDCGYRQNLYHHMKKHDMYGETSKTVKRKKSSEADLESLVTAAITKLMSGAAGAPQKETTEVAEKKAKEKRNM